MAHSDQAFPPTARRPVVLVTGARGRLAGEIIRAMRRDFACRLTDRTAPDGDCSGCLPADLTDFSQVYPRLTEGVEAVVHLAIASKRDLPTDPSPLEISPFEERTMAVNVQGTYHVFEAARRAGVKRIVFLSSMTVFHGDKHLPRYETGTPLNPQNLYACTKIFGENLGTVYARDHGMSVISLRIGQPYPTVPELDALWRTSKRARSHFVAQEDIAEAVVCALRTDVWTGIFNIVSASDNQRVDLAPAARIGYQPRYHFSDAGLQTRDDGAFPPPGCPVTHDGTEP